ncbi:hypothetical protein GCM10023116_08690 [Kistimonas scapharcae]|uniref:Uncharacterized protein n=1 Tax=Kistimonas scapharcae TaxID=1036133 RepID=A0ABP8UXN5_9GAMM
MTNDKRQLLEKQMPQMCKAVDSLAWSLKRCLPLPIASLDAAGQEKIEALTVRFVRVSDILIQKIFRLVDDLEMNHSGTIRDRINRMEEKGLIGSARDFIEIRELRNAIAQAGDDDASGTLYRDVIRLSPLLICTPDNVRHYLGSRVASAGM